VIGGGLANKDDPIMMAKLIDEQSRGWKEIKI